MTKQTKKEITFRWCNCKISIVDFVWFFKCPNKEVNSYDAFQFPTTAQSLPAKKLPKVMKTVEFRNTWNFCCLSLSQESNNNNKTAQSCKFNVAHLCHVKDASVIARARKWERNALNSNKNEWTQRQRRYIDKNPLLSVVVLVVEEEW